MNLLILVVNLLAFLHVHSLILPPISRIIIELVGTDILSVEDIHLFNMFI